MRIVWTAVSLALVAVMSSGTLTAQTPPTAEGGNGEKQATLVYAAEESKGIHFYRLLTSNLEVSQNITLAPLGIAAETPNPTYFVLDTKRRLLFAVNQVEQFEGKATGAVSAFSIDASGRLELLNQRSSMGRRPCHLTLDKEGRNILVANCEDGSMAVIPIGAGGQLDQATAVLEHAGKGAHSVTVDPSGRFAFVCSAGLDRILVYKFDAKEGKLNPADPAFVQMKAGSGPRRMLFRPDGRFAYVLNELSSTVAVFAYNPDTGALAEAQSTSTVPEYYDGRNAATELGIHPSGKYLYASNFGHNSVVLFEIDSEKGTLTYVEEQGTGGTNPLHFGIQPSAAHMAIVNHDTDQILISRIDDTNGRLKPSGVFTTLKSPACVRFLPPE